MTWVFWIFAELWYWIRGRPPEPDEPRTRDSLTGGWGRMADIDEQGRDQADEPPGEA